MGILIESIIKLIQKIFRKLGIKLVFSSDGEDSILEKWLGEIKNGFYIDIGSHKPLSSSNTYSFYLKGWKGICVDPGIGLVKKYNLIRPRDIFINSAITIDSKKKKMQFYYYCNNPDIATTLKNRVDIQDNLYNRKPSEIYDVEIISVRELIKKIPGKKVNFLNIDIEGEENKIIKSIIKNKVYPWCIAVEELGKTYQNLSSSEIKKFLSKNGYFLASRTFFTSIYIRKKKFRKLPSKYVKEINNYKFL
jgi:FkbM family methyltransferase